MASKNGIAYPLLPAGYAWKGWTEGDDPWRVWTYVSLRKIVKVLGIKIPIRVGLSVGFVDRLDGRNAVDRNIYAMAERLRDDKLKAKVA